MEVDDEVQRDTPCDEVIPATDLFARAKAKAKPPLHSVQGERLRRQLRKGPLRLPVILDLDIRQAS
eukprot:9773013-Prorocentrum_lima.AAC.1